MRLAGKSLAIQDQWNVHKTSKEHTLALTRHRALQRGMNEWHVWHTGSDSPTRRFWYSVPKCKRHARFNFMPCGLQISQQGGMQTVHPDHNNLAHNPTARKMRAEREGRDQLDPLEAAQLLWPLPRSIQERTTQGSVSKTACCTELQQHGSIHKARYQSSYAAGATARSLSANSSPLMGSSLPRSHDGTDVLAPAHGVEPWVGTCEAAMGLHGQLGKWPME